jgi:DNA-binding transcriptional regulator YiaG
LEFLDDGAEELQTDAVCNHLGVLTPKEILAVRHDAGLTRASFAELTGLGEATLARWETGTLIQSASSDRYLRLLRYPENLSRLKELKEGTRRVVIESPARLAKFNALAGAEHLLSKANKFDLVA